MSAASSAAEAPTPPIQPLIPSLPNDVALNCLARIPPFYHPTLSLVSKSIRSAVLSPQLYTIRSSLNCTQHFLYLSIRLSTSRSFVWYTLSQYPPNPSCSRKNNFVLAPVPPIPSPSLVGSAFVSVGPFIYAIGGSINDVPSTHVWVLDCRFHIWHAAPNMRVSREFAAAGLVADKIYVIGGCVADTWTRSKNWAEAFDLKKESWESVVSSSVVNREKWMHASAVIKGKIYSMGDRNGVVYEPSKELWEEADGELDLGWRGRACVIEEVLYCYDYLGKIRGYDARKKLWRELKVVKKGLPKFLCGATMANLGGKLAVLWEGKAGHKGTDIWCADISVGRDEGGDLWGRVEWSDVILTVPNGSGIVHSLAVTV